MVTKDEALKIVLSVLGPTPPDCCGCAAEWKIATDAAKEALAQPAQEPVIGTKTWFEDGKLVMRNLTAKEVYLEPAQEPAAIDGNTSDGYHTFNELYEFRKAYNAALFNEWAVGGKCSVHKSWRHHDGELCFGGGWFIVVAVLPNGQISNHYETKDWDLFAIPETERALFEFDGHTGSDVVARLKAYTSPPAAQPAQEPFGWYSAQEDDFMTDKIHKEHERLKSYTHIHGKFDLPLYTTPPAAQPAQEPVGEVVVESMGVPGSDAMQVRIHFYKEIPPVGSKIYTTPPQRPWVGLTDEELADLSASGLALWELWRAIEAKLKEKNT